MDKYAREEVTQADYAIDDSINGITFRIQNLTPSVLCLCRSLGIATRSRIFFAVKTVNKKPKRCRFNK